jgi:hypothetical protein
VGRFILSGHNIDEGITPIYTRNAAAGPLGLRGVGDWLVFDAGDGHPNTPVPQPPIVAGDRLEVITIGVGATPSPVEIAEWTVRSGLGGGSLNVWFRQATGDADDTFTVPATFVGQCMCQMASFFQPAGQSFVLEQSGVLTDNFANDWDIDGIGTTAEPDTIVLGYYMRARALFLPGLTASDNTSMITLGTQVRTDAAPLSAMWGGWSYRFDAVSTSVPMAEQGYTPDPTTATQITRVLRYKSEV